MLGFFIDVALRRISSLRFRASEELALSESGTALETESVVHLSVSMVDAFARRRATGHGSRG